MAVGMVFADHAPKPLNSIGPPTLPKQISKPKKIQYIAFSLHLCAIVGPCIVCSFLLLNPGQAFYGWYFLVQPRWLGGGWLVLMWEWKWKWVMRDKKKKQYESKVRHSFPSGPSLFIHISSVYDVVHVRYAPRLHSSCILAVYVLAPP